MMPAEAPSGYPSPGMFFVGDVSTPEGTIGKMQIGLDHSPGFGFMRPTDGIAEAASADTPFPGNIVWTFATNDEHRLQHWPDVIVRPGGPDMGAGNVSPLPAGLDEGDIPAT
jgi:hypothetical protein